MSANHYQRAAGRIAEVKAEHAAYAEAAKTLVEARVQHMQVSATIALTEAVLAVAQELRTAPGTTVTSPAFGERWESS